MVSIKKILNYSVLAIIILLGIYFRIKYFAFNRAFWGDEIAILVNLRNPSWLSVFYPLSMGQSTPPLYLLISKIQYTLFKDGNLELIFRSIPLLSSILSIFAFYYMCKRFVKNKICQIICMIIFCLNFHFIYFAQEFKQYSSDILIFILILLSYFHIDLNNKKSSIIYSSLYAIAIWFSYTSLFAMGAVLLTMLLQKANIKKLFKFALPLIISFILFYINLKHLANSDYLHTYWNNGFITLNTFFEIFIKAWKFFLTGINGTSCYIVFFILGIITAFINFKDSRNKLQLASLAFMLAASAMHLYPFFGRTSLYLFPVFIILLVKVFDIDLKRLEPYKNIALTILCIFVFMGFWNYKNLHNYKFVNIKSPILTAQQVSEDKENDILVFLKWDYVTYEAYYKDKLNITFKHALCMDQWFYPEEFDSLPKGYTYYFAMSVYDKDPNCLTSKYKKQYLLRLLNWAEIQKDYKLYLDDNLNVLIRFSK